jgi:hypothetical protein
MKNVAALYLCWPPAGAECLRRFIESYDAHPAGIEHNLYIILNDYTGQEEVRDLLTDLIAEGHHFLTTPFPMLDLAAYRWASTKIHEKYVCFMTAYARILHPGWLAKLHAALELPGVGYVGATGSWESHLTNRTTYALRTGDYSDLPTVEKYFSNWPNPHIRNTACLIERERWLDPELWGPFDAGPPQVLDLEFDLKNPRKETGLFRMSKCDTLLLESGLAGLPKHLAKQGLRQLVVGQDGVYEEADWAKSRTYRTGEQENLTVADNQTDNWMRMTQSEKDFYGGVTWSARRLLNRIPFSA